MLGAKAWQRATPLAPGERVDYSEGAAPLQRARAKPIPVRRAS
jgi:hypothetical protein